MCHWSRKKRVLCCSSLNRARRAIVTVEGQRAVHFINARIEQHHPAKTIRVQGKAADIIDGVLNIGRVVTTDGADRLLHRLIGRNRHATTFITGVGIIYQVITQIVIGIDQRAVVVKVNPSRLCKDCAGCCK